MDEELLDAPFWIGVHRGRQFIQLEWKSLAEHTRAWLVASGKYDQAGCRHEPERTDRHGEVEDLEYHVGVLKLCIDAEFPDRSLHPLNEMALSHKKLNHRVLSAAGDMLNAAYGTEVIFLRLALEAIQQHQVAHLLIDHPEIRVSGGKLSGLVIFSMILSCFSPALLAYAIVSAAKGELFETLLAVYGLAFSLFMLGYSRYIQKGVNKDYDAYLYWSGLLKHDDYDLGPWLTVGAGTQAYLEHMIRERIRVPPVALDLCSALRVCVLDRIAKPSQVVPACGP